MPDGYQQAIERALLKEGDKRTPLNIAYQVMSGVTPVSSDSTPYNKYHVADKEDRILDGILFDSKAEMERHAELLIEQRVGEITSLRRQPKYVLIDDFETEEGKKIKGISYIPDWDYVKNGQLIVEDKKGVKTPVYELKKKMFKYFYRHIQLIES